MVLLMTFRELIDGRLPGGGGRGGGGLEVDGWDGSAGLDR